MNTAATVPAEMMLGRDDHAAVLRLQHEITVLREARECVTDTATPAAIYGRVDGLISERQDRVLRIFQQARGVELQGVHDRG
ncbi:MAG: hypothetical protein ABIO17_12265 [Pseudoxanthomonas sp.]